MLIPRVIPCLLLDGDVLVKTRRFRKPVYIGDPVNVVNLFNRFEVDEIVLLDIRASLARRDPPFALLETLAAECWTPLAYGGGIASMAHIRRIFEIGVEKVILNTAAAEQPALLRKAAAIYGSQAIVASMDVRQPFWGRQNDCWTRSATRRLHVRPTDYARHLEDLGAGELLLMHCDRDGQMAGFDLPLIRAVSEAVSIPVIACGGAGERSDLARAVHEGGASAVAAGSLFVYQNRERGVLVNFPERDALEGLMATSMPVAGV